MCGHVLSPPSPKSSRLFPEGSFSPRGLTCLSLVTKALALVSGLAYVEGWNAGYAFRAGPWLIPFLRLRARKLDKRRFPKRGLRATPTRTPRGVRRNTSRRRCWRWISFPNGNPVSDNARAMCNFCMVSYRLESGFNERGLLGVVHGLFQAWRFLGDSNYALAWLSLNPSPKG